MKTELTNEQLTELLLEIVKEKGAPIQAGISELMNKIIIIYLN